LIAVVLLAAILLTILVARRIDRRLAGVAELSEIVAQAAPFALIVRTKLLNLVCADGPKPLAMPRSVPTATRGIDRFLAGFAELVFVVPQTAPFVLIVRAIFLDLVGAGAPNTGCVFGRFGR